MIRATPESVELAATRVLTRHAISAPPVDVDWIAEREGLRFEYLDLDRISGAYVREGERRGCAFISSREPPLRQRFSKAHELAHHLFDEPVISHAAGYPALRLPIGYRGRERHWAHEMFAACLLMPRAWVGTFIRDRGWMLDRFPQITETARIFHVSRNAAEVRLRELGHIEREVRW